MAMERRTKGDDKVWEKTPWRRGSKTEILKDINLSDQFVRDNKEVKASYILRLKPL